MPTFERVERYYRDGVTDAPRLPCAYADKTVEPEEVSVEFKLGRVHRLHIEGPTINANGKPGKSYKSESWQRIRGEWFPNVPPAWALEWLTARIAEAGIPLDD